MFRSFFPLLLLALATLPAAADDAPWQKLKAGGHVVLIRHASTVSGFGDPPGFKLKDCATQRNLSEAGREEARRLGAKFRVEAAPVDEVLSSRWCRCLDTARLAFGEVTPLPALDSFFDDRSTQERQTAAIRKKIAGFRGRGNLVMVTHQVNITALTGTVPAQGEALVVRFDAGGNVVLVGRIPPP
jgi:phosphohistidine phosphatase SixA